MSYLHVCMYSACVPGTHRDQKRALGPLEIELRLVVSCQLRALGHLQEQQVIFVVDDQDFFV